MNKRPSDADFAAENLTFRTACMVVGVKATRRQAAKWRNRQGAAWAYMAALLSGGDAHTVLARVRRTA